MNYFTMTNYNMRAKSWVEVTDYVITCHIIKTLTPFLAAFSNDPPHPSSISSGCAPIAKIFTHMF